MIVSVPVCTCGTLPDTGASSMVAPVARTRSAVSRLTRGLIVLRSTQIVPADRPARMPSGPEATVFSTSSLGRDVMTTSAAAATSRGVSFHFSPWPTSSCASSRERSSPYTSYPAVRKRAAMFPPMCPSPMTPIRACSVPDISAPPLDRGGAAELYRLAQCLLHRRWIPFRPSRVRTRSGGSAAASSPAAGS